jgi:hypothetical protein
VEGNEKREMIRGRIRRKRRRQANNEMLPPFLY